MSGCVEHELLEVPDTPDRLTMQGAGCLRWAVGGKRSGSLRFQERRENRNLSIEQEETKCGNTYLVSSVPDSPDRLALENGDSLSRAVGGKRPRSGYTERRENENSSSREQIRPKRGMTTSVSSSDCPYFSGMNSCGRQFSLSKRVAFSQDQDHEHRGSPLVETCKSAEDNNLPKNEELCHSAQEEVKRNMKESISGHAILTPKWNRRKMLVRNGRISPDGSTANANMSNRGDKRLQVAGDNLKGGMISCARQLSLSKKGASSQGPDHAYPGSPPTETCNHMSAEDKNLPRNDELCHAIQEEVEGSMKESISGHAILTPKWNQRKMLIRNGRISPDDATTNANMSNRGVKKLQVAGDNLKGGMTSCGRQLRLSEKGASAQDQDHAYPGSPPTETCNHMSAEDKNLPRNDELCHAIQEEVEGSMKESISGHAILTPKWNRRKMLVRTGRIFPDDAITNANMSNRGVKRLQVAGDNFKGGMMSCGRQLRLSKKGASAQDQDHAYLGSPPTETCNHMSAEDKNLPRNDELCHAIQEEVKGNMKESISGHAILTSKWNRRKMLVRNGRISPDDATTNTNKGMKRQEVAGDNLKGSDMNDVSAYANRSINGKDVLQPSGSCLPCSAQLDDRRKGKEIVSGDVYERGQESSVQLTQSRKRMRGNLSSSEEAIRLSRCLNTNTHRCHGSSSMVTEARSQEPTNGVLLNRSPDNESEENIQLARMPLLRSRIHQNEGQSSRLDKTSSRSSPLSLVVDEENSSDTGTPEVVFLRSSRQLRKNIPSTSTTCNAHSSNSDAIEVDNYSPIDVDSLQSPVNNIVNIDASNKVSEARLRQIEQDEILARQLQEELVGEILEQRLQGYDPVLHSTVQRERREHMSASDSGSVFPSLRASFGIGARREPARSLRNHPFSVIQAVRASPLSNLRSAHSRTIPVNGRVLGSGVMGRSRGRSVHDRTFRFPRNMNSEMRVDLLEAMEQIAENNDLAHQIISGVQRDFNEDDYEMLLALDDNNDNHRGASEQHIERLPTSIIKNDVSEEECSICLENPKVGDVIRHLLCMHKFHKECIDPWLAIHACCPVCKHSI